MVPMAFAGLRGGGGNREINECRGGTDAPGGTEGRGDAGKSIADVGRGGGALCVLDAVAAPSSAACADSP